MLLTTSAATPVVYIMVIFSLLRHSGAAGHGAV
jgi:hypothetical protein